MNDANKEKILKLNEDFEANKSSYIEDWKKFLSFKSISADPAFESDCLDCARWLEGYLSSLKFKTELIETSSKPLVYAEYIKDKSLKTILFYGHYDVQPVDPLDLWKSPPFEPEIREGRMYARGAVDNKGQVMYFLNAVKNTLKNGGLNCNLKILIEGEEESGSKAISESLPKIADKIKADTLMVCDTGTLGREFATITMGLRGMLSLEVRLDGASYDLHSGVHGGVVPNPATEIARLVATLHDSSGKIAVNGYYDTVAEVDPEDIKLANSINFSLPDYESQIGVKACGGEKGLSPMERRGFRPTIEVNGIYSGYMGPGGKTIIPSYAIAKISSRLVAGQEPVHCMQLLKSHLSKFCPEGLKISFGYNEIAGAALSLSSKSPIISKAREILDSICPKPTAFMWEGASVPIVPSLAAASGTEPILVGFSMEEDSIHAPNESFGLEQYHKGFLYASLMLSEN
jgi:acetylornithine deacetylase/succinyl-diaminopimelate desuccinylase-like protein